MANARSKNGQLAKGTLQEEFYKLEQANAGRPLSFGITPAARKELRALRLEQREFIHRAIYGPGSLAVDKVNDTNELLRIRFGAKLRAVARLERDTYVILRIGAKHHVESFYAKYHGSAFYRDAGTWMLLEKCGVRPFNVEASAASLIKTLEVRLGSQIGAIKSRTSELAAKLQSVRDDVKVLDMLDKDRSALVWQLRQDIQECLDTVASQSAASRRCSWPSLTHWLRTFSRHCSGELTRRLKRTSTSRGKTTTTETN